MAYCDKCGGRVGLCINQCTCPKYPLEERVKKLEAAAALVTKVEKLENEKLQWKSACEANRNDFTAILNEKQNAIFRLNKMVTDLEQKVLTYENVIQEAIEATGFMGVEEGLLGAIDALKFENEARKDHNEVVIHGARSFVKTLRERDADIVKLKELLTKALRSLPRPQEGTEFEKTVNAIKEAIK